MKLVFFFALCIAAAMAGEPRWLIIPEAEVALVQEGWSRVKNNEVEILYFIFKKYPDLQTKFAAFNGKDLDSIKDTGKFALHAGRIVNFFSQYIELLGRTQTQPAIKTVLNELGSTHKDRGITKEQFNEFETGLIAYLKEHVSWGDNVQKAWEDTFDKAYFVIFSNLDGHPVQ
jgi:hemoglobin-like flavoprotein